ncbi:type II toxin-antitoxin system Phd/YefM family antitoxin [Acidithiobacillus sp. IBUN Pt1247-S3]|uniref:type II toxin-antitoxin system Phd/YefM family antitoxin n=1 Tax=Acidithiobacillus sp. IBUN Pt1247-S3 TaxID=3166642 RepID=UPI0034E3C0BF
MSKANPQESKTQLPREVDQIGTGEEIIISRAGKPRPLGLGVGRFTMPEEFDHFAQAEIKAMFIPSKGTV